MVGVIKLKEDEVKFLIGLVKKGQKSARELTRARILLLAFFSHHSPLLICSSSSYIKIAISSGY